MVPTAPFTNRRESSHTIDIDDEFDKTDQIYQNNQNDNLFKNSRSHEVGTHAVGSHEVGRHEVGRHEIQSTNSSNLENTNTNNQNSKVSASNSYFENVENVENKPIRNDPAIDRTTSENNAMNKLHQFIHNDNEKHRKISTPVSMVMKVKKLTQTNINPNKDKPKGPFYREIRLYDTPPRHIANTFSESKLYDTPSEEKQHLNNDISFQHNKKNESSRFELQNNNQNFGAKSSQNDGDELLSMVSDNHSILTAEVENAERNSHLWNNNVEMCFDEIIERLKVHAEECHVQALRHTQYDSILKVATVLSGVVVTLASTSSIDTGTRAIITGIGGVVSSTVASCQAILKYGKKAEAEKFAEFQLDKMARSVQLELASPQEYRMNPIEYIANIELEREKILKNLSGFSLG